MPNKEWILVPHTYQIADTGDYDGHWQLTNGDISLITKDDHLGDEEGLQLVKALNDTDCKWICPKLDNLDYELYLTIIELTNSTKAQQLASELYEDLKEKHIKLQEEKQYLVQQLHKLRKKVNKLSSDDYILRFGRKQFNFALKLCNNVVNRIAVNHNLPLDSVVELVKEIKEIKKPPITKENIHIMNDIENEGDD